MSNPLNPNSKPPKTSLPPTSSAIPRNRPNRYHRRFVVPEPAHNTPMRTFIIILVGVLAMATLGASKAVEVEGHRGEPHDAPENTMASFHLAWQRNDDAAELDVHLSRDGKLIVSHDADLARTAGTKLLIKDHTADELRKLDVGKWKGQQFTGEKLPLLEEVLPTIPPGKRLFIEVKIGPEAIAPISRALASAGKTPGQTVIIAFDINVIREARKALPALKAYWLVSQKQDKQTKQWKPSLDEMIHRARDVNASGLDISANPTITPQFVQRIHDAGLELYVWTVDDPAQAKKLANAGVDGITTNRAAWLKEQLQRP